MTTSSYRSPRSARKTSTARLIGLLSVFVLLAAACGDGEPSADGQGTSTDELAFASEESEADGDESAMEEEEDTPTVSVTLPSTTTMPIPATTVSSTPTTLGSGKAPVTTVVVGSGGDPQGIYRGRIGNLALDHVVVPGVMAPPSVADGVAPLTGLATDVPTRPAAVVKIDNGPAATPQQGLNAADIVIEEEVEGGVTRFAAVFHSTPSIVGPVRSGRTTDLSLVSGLGDPLLIYSGANQITEGILRSNSNIQNRSHGSASGYWRESGRRAPSNLFSDTAPNWASAVGGPPPAQFAYRDSGDPVPGATDDELTISYGASTARWEWDGSQWLRWQRGSKHLVVSGEQVSAANVVVIEAEKVATGMTDASGGAVPEFLFVGTGRATIFTEGKRIEGAWTRPTLSSVATLTHGIGDAIELTPGRTWIQLIEADSGLLG